MREVRARKAVMRGFSIGFRYDAAIVVVMETRGEIRRVV